MAGTSDCSTGNCKDGLVSVQSAVMPDATQIRYVPYKHSPSIPFPLFTPSIAYVTASSRNSHLTYQLVRELVRGGDVLPQCCGTGTLNYTPSFFQGAQTAEGFLFLRVIDSVTKSPIKAVRRLDFSPAADVPPPPLNRPDPRNVNKNGGAFVYFPLVAPDTYHVTIKLGGGYPDVDIPAQVVQRLRPTVPAVIEVQKK